MSLKKIEVRKHFVLSCIVTHIDVVKLYPKNERTFKAACLRRISLDLNITAAIQIVTKKPEQQSPN
jgi:hypothetical protein